MVRRANLTRKLSDPPPVRRPPKGCPSPPTLGGPEHPDPTFAATAWGRPPLAQQMTISGFAVSGMVSVYSGRACLGFIIARGRKASRPLTATNSHSDFFRRMLPPPMLCCAARRPLRFIQITTDN